MKHYSIISDCWFLIQKYRKHFPSALFLSVLEIVLTVIHSVMVIFLPKLAVDIVTGDSNRGLGELIIFCLFYIFAGAVRSGSNGKKYMFMGRMRQLLLGELFLKSLKLPYEQGEEGTIKDNYWKAVSSLNNGDFSSESRLTNGIIGILINGSSFFLYASFIGVLNLPVMLGLIVLSLINSSAHFYQIRYLEKTRDETAKLGRQYDCITNSIGNTEYAKDIRLFEMDGWLSGRKDRIIEKRANLYLRRGK